MGVFMAPEGCDGPPANGKQQQEGQRLNHLRRTIGDISRHSLHKLEGTRLYAMT